LEKPWKRPQDKENQKVIERTLFLMHDMRNRISKLKVNEGLTVTTAELENQNYTSQTA
jgi:hypothetical protein